MLCQLFSLKECIPEAVDEHVSSTDAAMMPGLYFYYEYRQQPSTKEQPFYSCCETPSRDRAMKLFLESL